MTPDLVGGDTPLPGQWCSGLREKCPPQLTAVAKPPHAIPCTKTIFALASSSSSSDDKDDKGGRLRRWWQQSKRPPQLVAVAEHPCAIHPKDWLALAFSSLSSNDNNDKGGWSGQRWQRWPSPVRRASWCWCWTRPSRSSTCSLSSWRLPPPLLHLPPLFLSSPCHHCQWLLPPVYLLDLSLPGIWHHPGYDGMLIL